MNPASLQYYSSLAENKVVTVNDFLFVNIPKCSFNILTGSPRNATGVATALVDETARNFGAVLRKAGDGCAAFEFALNLDNADGQKAFPFAERFDCAGVEN